MNRPTAVGGAAGLALLLTACADPTPPQLLETPDAVESAPPLPSPTPEVLTISGALAVAPAYAITSPESDTCLAMNPYVDFRSAGQVTIADADGTTVGLSDLMEPVSLEGGCVRWFTAEVPAGGGFYTAAVGDWTSETYVESALQGGETLLIMLD
jgi:hypothetical protein